MKRIVRSKTVNLNCSYPAKSLELSLKGKIYIFLRDLYEVEKFARFITCPSANGTFLCPIGCVVKIQYEFTIIKMKSFLLCNIKTKNVSI